jgi:hypothetical protein
MTTDDGATRHTETAALGAQTERLRFENKRLRALLYEALSEMTGNRDYGSWSELTRRIKNEVGDE